MGVADHGLVEDANTVAGVPVLCTLGTHHIEGLKGQLDVFLFVEIVLWDVFNTLPVLAEDAAAVGCRVLGARRAMEGRQDLHTSLTSKIEMHVDVFLIFRWLHILEVLISLDVLLWHIRNIVSQINPVPVTGRDPDNLGAPLCHVLEVLKLDPILQVIEDSCVSDIAE